MGIPLLQGRDFTLRDTAGSTRVAVVNQAFVRQFLGSASPLGRTLRTLAEPRYPETVYEIVGVIADTRYNSYRSGMQPMAFAPDSQFPDKGPWAAVMIHGSGDAAVTGVTVRRVLSERYPQMAMEFVPFQARIRSGLIRERLLAVLAGFFGVLAALLVMVGLYGMISFGVAERRHEIGIRIALGAERRAVVSLIMRQAAVVLTIGIVAGSAIALAAAPAAASVLFELEPSDPAILASACLALLVVAALASYIPARRAARLNPVIALRQE
jgi:ABC-type antimicrobial peptide transport system permease subunit